VTKVKRAAIDSANNNNNQQSKEMENERKRSAMSTRHATARIAPLNKLPNIEESDTVRSNKGAVNSERIKSVKVDKN